MYYNFILSATAFGDKYILPSSLVIEYQSDLWTNRYFNGQGYYQITNILNVMRYHLAYYYNNNIFSDLTSFA